MACSDLPPRNVCPWPVQNFTLNKCSIPIDKTPEYLNGEYRVDFEVLQGMTTLGGYQAFFNVINID